MVTKIYHKVREEYPKPYSFHCEKCGKTVIGEIRASLQPGFLSFYRPKFCTECDDSVSEDMWFETRRLFEIHPKE